MAGVKRRVVVLRNFDSDTIDQAIIVLKDGCTKDVKEGIVNEAEKIIDDYIYAEKYNNTQQWNPVGNNKRDSIVLPKSNKNNKNSNIKLDKYLNILIAICCISALYLFFRLI